MEIKEGIVFKRADIDKKKDFKNIDLLRRRLCFLALKDDKVIGTIEFNIFDMVNARIEHINISWDKATNHLELLEGFIQEFLWWNEYIKNIAIEIPLMKKISEEKNDILRAGFLKGNVYTYENPNPAEIFKIKVKDVCPSQLTVDRSKLKQLKEWVKSSEEIICTFVRIDGKAVCIDGHTRLVYAILNDYKYIYGIYTKEYDDIGLYEETLRWCRDEKIYSAEDLVKNIVDTGEHEKIWISRCRNYLKSV
ncbi:hypothetical protein [Oceanirhabdus seepicola]|uniref:ParB/Sulfiredoxin domain-containing protein n=1 Tax=Oceanirhabdus seepicola TaxID=2828781 RepID=A0A9J6P610_9CLOT|nr:hypothetical protein [Oceanirhabdus seepicola]MCM1990920.1 hypothetical protein [Oceanirhabdus seepicola]